MVHKILLVAVLALAAQPLSPSAAAVNLPWAKQQSVNSAWGSRIPSGESTRARGGEGEPLRLRGAGRMGRTQPSKVDPKFWTKKYDPTWHTLKIRRKIFTGFDENDPTIEKAEPGNLWSVGAKPRNWIPHLKLGKDIPYEMAGELDGGACLYHRDTMEPMDINKIIMDDTKDEWIESRWHDDEITPAVAKCMKNPRKHHAFVKKMCDRTDEEDWERSKMTRRVRAALRAHDSPRHVATETGGFLERMRAAAGKSRASGGAVEVVGVQAGNHSFAELHADLLGIGNGVDLEIRGPGGVFAKDGGVANLEGCLWLHYKTGGKVAGVRVTHRADRPLDEDDELGEPLSAITALGGPWLFESCDIKGGYAEVISLREHSEVEMRSCCIGDVYMSKRKMLNLSVYEMYHPVYDKWFNLTGVPRLKDGFLVTGSARLRASSCLFDKTLKGGGLACGEGVVVMDQCTFANWHVAIELHGNTKAALSDCCFHYLATALNALENATALMERCVVNRTNLGVAIHDSSSVAIRGCKFINSFDGSLVAGRMSDGGRALEITNSTFECKPNSDYHTGYVWFHTKRPRKIVDGGNNTVLNDPYYPSTFDLEAEHDMPIEKLHDWVDAKYEELLPGFEPPRKKDPFKGVINLAEIIQAREGRERRDAVVARKEAALEENDVEHGPVEQSVLAFDIPIFPANGKYSYTT